MAGLPVMLATCRAKMCMPSLIDHDAAHQEDGQDSHFDLLTVEQAPDRLRDDLETDDTGEYRHHESGDGLGALVAEGMVRVGLLVRAPGR